MVTRKPFSLAPFGLAAIAAGAGCVAPLGLAVIGDDHVFRRRPLVPRPDRFG